MAWDQQGGGGGFGGPGGYPPPPLFPPSELLEPPTPRHPPDALRAIAVGVLNLSGLGLGYALIRRWAEMAVCLVATVILLLVALPADPDGVSRGAVTAYLAFLALAAVHGAVRGLRTPLSWPPRAPVAIVLGLVLLAVPVGGVVLYDGARDEATQQMLLDRLAETDQLVKTAGTKSFDAAQGDFRTALSQYRALRDDHPDSRAAGHLPDRLKTYYAVVSAPYDQKHYCDAVAPLKYLRTVPGTYGKKDLGTLATWPDDRLATSLYECGAPTLRPGGSAGGGDAADLGELLSTFPASPQAAKIEPAVRSSIAKAAQGISGSDPCTATDQVRDLGQRAADLGGTSGADKAVAGSLGKDAKTADTYVQSGTYTCGVHQYKAGDFDSALEKMTDFVKANPHAKNRPLADKIAIAAEVAQKDPAAGKRLPTTSTRGSISVTVSNDSPDAVEILFTGPVTGRFTLKGCSGCSTYATERAAKDVCSDSSKHYPHKTLTLPVGTTYFLNKPTGDTSYTPSVNSLKLEAGYIYTDCAYTVRDQFAL